MTTRRWCLIRRIPRRDRIISNEKYNGKRLPKKPKPVFHQDKFLAKSGEKFQELQRLNKAGKLCGFLRQPIHYYKRTGYLAGYCPQIGSFCLYHDNPGHEDCSYKPQLTKRFIPAIYIPAPVLAIYSPFKNNLEVKIQAA